MHAVCLHDCGTYLASWLRRTPGTAERKRLKEPVTQRQWQVQDVGVVLFISVTKNYKCWCPGLDSSEGV